MDPNKSPEIFKHIDSIPDINKPINNYSQDGKIVAAIKAVDSVIGLFHNITWANKIATYSSAVISMVTPLIKNKGAGYQQYVPTAAWAAKAGIGLLKNISHNAEVEKIGLLVNLPPPTNETLQKTREQTDQIEDIEKTNKVDNNNNLFTKITVENLRDWKKNDIDPTTKWANNVLDGKILKENRDYWVKETNTFFTRNQQPKFFIYDLDSDHNLPISEQRIELDYRPTELHYNPELSIATIHSIGRNNQNYHFTGSEDSLSFEIDWFIKKEEDIEENMRKVEWLESISKNKGYEDVPHKIMLIWSEEEKNVLFADSVWVITKCPYKMTHFFNHQYNSSSTGYPLVDYPKKEMVDHKHYKTMLPQRIIQQLELKRVGLYKKSYPSGTFYNMEKPVLYTKDLTQELKSVGRS